MRIETEHEIIECPDEDLIIRQHQITFPEISRMAIDEFGSKAFYMRVMKLYNNTIDDYNN